MSTSKQQTHACGLVPLQVRKRAVIFCPSHIKYYVGSTVHTFNQQSVEKIQRRATKLVSEIKDLQYVDSDRLNHLNLPSLRYQRCRGNLIYTYRLFHNMLDMDNSSLFTLRSSSITRGQNVKIYKPHAT